MGKQKEFIQIERPFKEKQLPTVLSLKEVKSILNGTKNLKHKAILSTIYACGLRVSEVCNIQISRINGKRKVLHLKQSKGKKDRIVPIPDS